MSGPVDLPSTGVPIKAWVRGVPVADNALEQLRRTAELPFVHHHLAVMPDVHFGIGATIGSVIPTVGAIVPDDGARTRLAIASAYLGSEGGLAYSGLAAGRPGSSSGCRWQARPPGTSPTSSCERHGPNGWLEMAGRRRRP